MGKRWGMPRADLAENFVGPLLTLDPNLGFHLPPGFKWPGLKGAAAAEVTAGVSVFQRCLMWSKVLAGTGCTRGHLGRAC